MKKFLKVLSLVLVFALVFMPTVSLAKFSISVSSYSNQNLNNTVGSILGLLQWVGYAVAVVLIITLGVQWMLAQPSKKAELKSKMWSMAIGILLLVGGVTVINIVWDYSTTLSTQLK